MVASSKIVDERLDGGRRRFFPAAGQRSDRTGREDEVRDSHCWTDLKPAIGLERHGITRRATLCAPVRIFDARRPSGFLV
jgi:hypothetical protein